MAVLDMPLNYDLHIRAYIQAMRIECLTLCIVAWKINITRIIVQNKMHWSILVTILLSLVYCPFNLLNQSISSWWYVIDDFTSFVNSICQQSLIFEIEVVLSYIRQKIFLLQMYYCQTNPNQQGLITPEKPLFLWNNISKAHRLTSFHFHEKRNSIASC